MATISSEVATGRRINRREGFMLQLRRLFGRLLSFPAAALLPTFTSTIGLVACRGFVTCAFVFIARLGRRAFLAGSFACFARGATCFVSTFPPAAFPPPAIVALGSASGIPRSGFDLGALAQPVGAVNYHSLTGFDAGFDDGRIAFRRPGLHFAER